MSTGTLRKLEGPTLSMLLAGKTVAEVSRNNELLVIRMDTGDEIRVAWIDINGVPVKGEPAIAFFGRNIRAKVGKLAGRGVSL
jgi:hypothetical protein